VQGGAAADHAQHVGVVLAVGRQGRRHDLDFLEIVGREKRTNRPVDQTGGEGLLGGGAALAFDEAAGELAGGVGLLAVVNDEGEEVAARTFRALDGSDQHDGIAVANGDGPVGLFGELTGLEDEVGGTERAFDVDSLHGSIPPVTRKGASRQGGG
jgi:hypothetical protein